MIHFQHSLQKPDIKELLIYMVIKYNFMGKVNKTELSSQNRSIVSIRRTYSMACGRKWPDLLCIRCRKEQFICKYLLHICVFLTTLRCNSKIGSPQQRGVNPVELWKCEISMSSSPLERKCHLTN